MKAKNQGPRTSEEDAREKLIVYVYEYLTHSGASRAASAFLDDIQYKKDIQLNSLDGQGFLVDWWCVFWDLYCAEPGKRNQPEPSNEARAFHEYNMRSVMSPQTSPPQPHVGGPPPPGPAPFLGGGVQMPLGGPRYGPPHPGSQMRGGGPPPMNAGPPPSRMQGMVQPLQPPQMGAPPPHGPPHQQMMGGAASPRYAQHPGHMTPGSSASGGGPIGGPEPGPSPGLPNRMTPNHSGSPHPQVGGPAGVAMQQMGGPPPGQPPQPPMPQGGPPPPPSSMQRGGGMPPQGGPGGPPSGWQGNQFNVNSPADQQCFMPGPPSSSGQQGEFGGMMMNDGSGAPPNQQPPANQPQDEYVMPGAYGQQPDQGDANTEIMKLKESLENNTNEGDQSAFNMDFPDGHPKW